MSNISSELALAASIKTVADVVRIAQRQLDETKKVQLDLDAAGAAVETVEAARERVVEAEAVAIVARNLIQAVGVQAIEDAANAAPLVAEDKRLAEEAREAAEDIRVVVLGLSDQVQMAATNAGAAAALSGSFPTFPDAPTFAAFPEGHAFSVDGPAASAGTYAKRNSAAVLISKATVPGLDARAVSLEAMLAAAESSSRALTIVDPDYNVIAEFSADARTFKVVAGILSLLSSGVTRLARHDGLSAVDLRADGVALPGAVLGTRGSTTTDFALTDEDGFWILRALAGGAGIQIAGMTIRLVNGAVEIVGPAGTVAITLPAAGGAVIGGTEVASVTRSDFVFGVRDDDGFLGWGIAPDGRVLTAGTATVGYTADDIQAMDAAAQAYTDGLRRSINATTARLIWDYALVLLYGQSLSEGSEGWPALSKTARPGTLMVGDAVRPTSGGSTWTPVGTAAFKPLVATVRGAAGVPLSDAEVAALEPGAGNQGETPLEGALRFFRKLWDQERATALDTSRLLVGMACGAPGKTIEELSKGASPDLYSRMGSAASVAKGLAAAGGKTLGVPYVMFLQGEQNYSSNYAGAQDKPTYKAKLKQLVADLRADVQVDVLGQSDPFGFITYQTGAGYTSDAFDLAIGMAQLELSNEEPNWFLAAPHYPIVDKNGHLASNGYRWLGKQFGKVMFRLSRGEIWKPLQPIALKCKGRDALVSFHAPAAPLKWGLPYTQAATVDFADKGFTFIDSIGVVPITAVEIAAPRVVRFTLARLPSGPLAMRYADKTYHQGNGNLCDSDQTVADEVYEYTPGSGQYASENIAALVGKPYNLNNWCVAGHWPVTVEA